VSGDLGVAWPDIFQVDRFPVFAGSDRFLRDVDIDRARDRERDDERRAHQEVRLQRLVYARFEIAVARQHCDADQVVLDDGILDGRVERPGTAHAGGAAVAHEVEPELFQVGEQARLLQVFAHDARAGRERGFDARMYFQTALDGFFRKQSGSDQHRRVRSVRARRDGRDEHVAVADVEPRRVSRGHACAIACALAVAALGRRLREQRAETVLEPG
jgi:hypothetical protein